MIERAKYVSLTQDAHSATVTTDSGQHITSRYVIGCDGLHSRVAEDMGVVKKAPRGAKRYGLRQHFAVAPWSSNIEVFYSPDAEVYITPVSSDTVGVAVLGPKGVNLESAVAAIPELHAHLAGAQPASTLRGAGPFPTQSQTQELAGSC